MLTRSKTKIEETTIMKRENTILLDIDINFDEAINEWKKNKNVLKCGMYSYKKGKQNCCYINNENNENNENNKKCRKKHIIGNNYCENHY